jgi:hypothetical protein
MKKPAKKSSAKKAAKPAAKKSTKPAAKSKSAPAAKARPAASKPVAKAGAGTYTPQPIEGIGWAPFRYPLS